MSRPFEGIQQPTTDGWQEVEQGIHVTSLDHLVNECRFNEKALAKLIRAGGVVVARKGSDEVEARDDKAAVPFSLFEGMSGEEIAAALLDVARIAQGQPSKLEGAS